MKSLPIRSENTKKGVPVACVSQVIRLGILPLNPGHKGWSSVGPPLSSQGPIGLIRQEGSRHQAYPIQSGRQNTIRLIHKISNGLQCRFLFAALAPVMTLLTTEAATPGSLFVEFCRRPLTPIICTLFKISFTGWATATIMTMTITITACRHFVPRSQG